MVSLEAMPEMKLLQTYLLASARKLHRGELLFVVRFECGALAGKYVRIARGESFNVCSDSSASGGRNLIVKRTGYNVTKLETPLVCLDRVLIIVHRPRRAGRLQ